MKISKKEVEQVARLARIELTEAEKKKFSEHLNQILGYVEKLNELDTEDIKPTAHVVGRENVLREDKVKPSLTEEETLANAPRKKGTYFQVPRIIEEQ